MADARDVGKKMGKIMAKALSEPDFHNKLKSDPKGALKDHGVEIPADARVTVHESDDKNIHLVLPSKPEGAVSDEHLAAVAGGSTNSSAGTAGSAACPVSSASSAGTAGSAGN